MHLKCCFSEGGRKSVALTWLLIITSATTSPTPRPPKAPSPSPSELTLIEKGASWFPNKEPLKGYEEFMRKYNESIKASLFVSVHMPDIVVLHNGTNDEGKPLVVLPPKVLLDTVKVPFKNVSCHLVFREVPKEKNKYTAHLAYIRVFGHETSLEWDVYSIHYHTDKGNFVTAFLPLRDGPSILTVGIGMTITRSKRHLEARLPPNPDLSKLHWSWRTTDPPVSLKPQFNLEYSGGVSATEFPMYEDFMSNSLDAYGFTKHPPWSPYAQLFSQSTPPPFEAESRDLGSGALEQKRLCFGLHHTNCGQKRAAPKPKVTKACLFGLRCKESSFVDRFAVKVLTTTTTTTEAPMVPIEPVGEVDPSTGKKKKKKKTGESLMIFEEKVKDNYTEDAPEPKKKKKTKAHVEEIKVEPPTAETSVSDIIPLATSLPPTNESDIAPTTPKKKKKKAPVEEIKVRRKRKSGSRGRNPRNRKRDDDLLATNVEFMIKDAITDAEMDDYLFSPTMSKRDSNATELSQLDLPYSGVRNCTKTEPSASTSWPKDPKGIVENLLKTLRADCEEDISSSTMKLFDDRLVTITNDGGVGVKWDNSFYAKKTLNEPEWVQLASALLLSSFSQVYPAQLKTFLGGHADNHFQGRRLSGTVVTLVKLTHALLSTLQSPSQGTNHHAVKVTNLILMILQAQRSEFVTKGEELAKCEMCEEEKWVNLSDQVVLFSLMRFVVDEFPSLVNIPGGKSVEGLFDAFYKKHLDSTTASVKSQKPFVY